MKQGRRRREPGKDGGDSPYGPWRLQEHYTLKSDNPETRIALGSRMTPRSGNPGEGKGGENLRGSAGSHQEPSAYLAGHRCGRIHRLASPGNPAISRPATGATWRRPSARASGRILDSSKVMSARSISAAGPAGRWMSFCIKRPAAAYRAR